LTQTAINQNLTIIHHGKKCKQQKQATCLIFTALQYFPAAQTSCDLQLCTGENEK